MNEVTENNYTCFLSSPIKAYLPLKQTDSYLSRNVVGKGGRRMHASL